MTSLITFDAKHAGERSAGNPPAPFDEAGVGNVTMAAGLRASTKALEHPPEPNVGAPVLDPTGGRVQECRQGMAAEGLSCGSTRVHDFLTQIRQGELPMGFMIKPPMSAG